MERERFRLSSLCRPRRLSTTVVRERARSQEGQQVRAWEMGNSKGDDRRSYGPEPDSRRLFTRGHRQFARSRLSYLVCEAEASSN